MAKLTDEEIKKIAKARAGFKAHFSVYLIVNLFLAALWWITIGRTGVTDLLAYWPLWPHLGWGVGVALHGFSVYGAADWERREEEKLRQKYGGA